jgi:hypothetical protein
VNGNPSSMSPLQHLLCNKLGLKFLSRFEYMYIFTYHVCFWELDIYQYM